MTSREHIHIGGDSGITVPNDSNCEVENFGGTGTGYGPDRNWIQYIRTTPPNRSGGYITGVGSVSIGRVECDAGSPDMTSNASLGPVPSMTAEIDVNYGPGDHHADGLPAAWDVEVYARMRFIDDDGFGDSDPDLFESGVYTAIGFDGGNSIIPDVDAPLLTRPVIMPSTLYMGGSPYGSVYLPYPSTPPPNGGERNFRSGVDMSVTFTDTNPTASLTTDGFVLGVAYKISAPVDPSVIIGVGIVYDNGSGLFRATLLSLADISYGPGSGPTFGFGALGPSNTVSTLIADPIGKTLRLVLVEGVSSPEGDELPFEDIITVYLDGVLILTSINASGSWMIDTGTYAYFGYAAGPGWAVDWNGGTESWLNHKVVSHYYTEIWGEFPDEQYLFEELKTPLSYPTFPGGTEFGEGTKHLDPLVEGDVISLEVTGSGENITTIGRVNGQAVQTIGPADWQAIAAAAGFDLTTDFPQTGQRGGLSVYDSSGPVDKFSVCAIGRDPVIPGTAGVSVMDASSAEHIQMPDTSVVAAKRC